MSTQEQTTVIGNSGYTPLDQRESTTGKVQEDRPEFQRKADERFTAVMPYKSPDELRIEELERQINEGKRQAEYLQCKTDAEKELFGLYERIETKQQKADAAAEQRSHTKKFEPQLTRLKALRAEIIDDETRKASELVAVDHAIIQFSTIGACDKTGHKMLEAIEANETNRIVSQQSAIIRRRDDLRAEAAKLDAQLGIEPENYTSAEDQLYIQARREWEAAREAGDDTLAGQLRSNYFAERIQREKAAKNE